MPTYVPPIATLRARAAELIGRGVGRGELKAMMAAICAAENAGTPIPADSTGQTWITESQGIINQADQDALAILVREFAELVENLSGGGSGPPVFLGPDPSTGEEDEYYSYSIRAEGTLPITFTLIAGTLPTGTTLSGNLISGIPTNGNLYEFTLRASNSAGTEDNDFSILINGVAPVLTYVTNGAFVYPGTAGFWSYLRGASAGQTLIGLTLTPTVLTGSTPIVCSVHSGSLPTSITINSSTGVISGTAAAATVGSYYSATLRATNLFGFDPATMPILSAALVFWGEWTGAVPGTFTAANITDDLTDDFGDMPSGPRRSNYNAYGLAWEIDLVTTNVQQFIEGVTTGYFLFPATAGAKTRVLAIPSGFFTGTQDPSLPTATAPFTALIATVDADADFNPAFPTPYQSGLVINGVPYDIFVITARDDQFAVNWQGS
ncbi:MAG: hypothetical protein E6Q97_11140 [Desulfurellales bacterium]|nr:MAG: hypothetical protein E6Q97_11140 [Desulfurellales bacterium]